MTRRDHNSLLLLATLPISARKFISRERMGACLPIAVRSNSIRPRSIHLHLPWDGAMSIAHSFTSRGISSILLAGLILGAIPAMAQNASNVQRDPDAIALIQRVLDASGGDASIAAVRDLVATGTISNPPNSKDTEEGSVTISLRGADQLRIDTVRQTGTRSDFYNRDSRSSKATDGTVHPLGHQDETGSASHLFPLESLAAALKDSSYSVIGPETITDKKSGRDLLHLRIQHARTEVIGSAHYVDFSIPIDYYIDETTNQIVRVQSHIDPREIMQNNRGTLEVYEFSDYRVENGILLPHQIAESLDRRLLYTVHISSYKFNTGLADTDFSPVGKPYGRSAAAGSWPRCPSRPLRGATSIRARLCRGELYSFAT